MEDTKGTALTCNQLLRGNSPRCLQLYSPLAWVSALDWTIPQLQYEYGRFREDCPVPMQA